MPKKSSDPMLEAHVSFELKQWRGATLKKRLKEEVSALWALAGELTPNDLSSAEALYGIAESRILQQPLSDELKGTVANITKHLLALPVNETTQLHELLSDELVEEGVEMAVGMRHVREEIIRQAVRSPVFEMLIADNLYNGIRDYVTKDNVVTQRMPGVGKLIGKGAGTLSKATGMGEKLDFGLRSWIDANVPKLTQQSEKFLQEALTDERIREVATDVWRAARKSHLSITEFLGDEDVDALASFGQSAWGEIRQSDYLAELLREGISSYFDANGDRKINELLAELQLDEKTLQKEATAHLPTAIKALDDNGYLEATIRRRLAPFYASLK